MPRNKCWLVPSPDQTWTLHPGFFLWERDRERKRERERKRKIPCGTYTARDFSEVASDRVRESGSQEGSKCQGTECRPETESLMRSGWIPGPTQGTEITRPH